ncbi:MAG: SusF/SusE family outer membrane protein [Muribaculaceae bacterium]|nr:SusF/SusE family outer membrane protein [Muribaculaceae bacterium]
MNKIFKSALLLMGAVLMFTSCSDDRDSNPVLQQPESFVLNTPAYAGQAIDLANSQTVNLTWSQPDYGGFPVAVEYTVEVSATNQWTTSYAEETADDTGETQCDYYAFDNIFSTCNAEVSASELAKALVVICNYVDGEIPAEQEVYARVKANTPGAKEVVSNVVKLLVTPYYIELRPADPVLWYMVGNCIGSNDWDNGSGSVGTGLVPLLPEPGADFDKDGNGSLVYAGYFPAGGQFKFVRDPGDWGTQMNFTNIDENTAGVTDEDGDNHNIGIPEDGYYKITMNTVKGTFSMEKLDGTYAEHNSMGIPGEHNGWDPAGNAMTAMGKRDNTENHEWMGDITFESAGKFKFAANGSWDVNWGGADFPLGIGTQGGADIVAKPGSYKVYFNDILGLYYFLATE